MATPPAPEWSRVPGAQALVMPVGDPTVWSGTVTTQIDSDPLLGNTARVVGGGQILLAQGADRYARSWTIVGALTMVPGAWQLARSSLVPGNPLDTVENGDTLSVWLEVTQGIGQVSLTQLVLLNVGDDSSGLGLVHDQCVVNGGVYGQTYPAFSAVVPVINPFGSPLAISRSFACVGAWVGNTVSVRALYARGSDGAGGILSPGAVPSATLSLLMTPYAPGAGI